MISIKHITTLLLSMAAANSLANEPDISSEAPLVNSQNLSEVIFKVKKNGILSSNKLFIDVKRTKTTNEVVLQDISGKQLFRLNSEINLAVKPGSDINRIIALVDADLVQKHSLKNYIAYTISLRNSSSLLALTDALEVLGVDDSVIFAEPNWNKNKTKRNDPFLFYQWHIENTGQVNGSSLGEDINFGNSLQEADGTGVFAGIVDDGLEIMHEDLVNNSNLSTVSISHLDLVDGDSNPTAGEHGTSVAGLIGAEMNQLGVRGVAPATKLVGIRLLGANTDSNEVTSLTHHNQDIQIYNNSWGPPDGGYLLEGPGFLTTAALEEGVSLGRGGLGSIFVWAAGNGGSSDNSNYDGYANSIYAIAVAATDAYGEQAYYSEPGANILVNAPSSGSYNGITTTDRTGVTGYNSGINGDLNDTNYTSAFGGTSAATPIVSGVISLLLDKDPYLSWRDIKGILAESAYKNNPTDSDWMQNGAGYWVNHKYGFGRIDATRALALIDNWQKVPSYTNLSYQQLPMLAIPDTDAQGVSSDIDVGESISIQDIKVTFSSSDHPRWGDIEITLTSPSGTVSKLSEAHSTGNGARYVNWSFSSKRHYKENSQGKWTLTVKDLTSSNVGTFEGWQLDIYGTPSSSGNTIADGDLAPLGNRDGVINIGDALVALRIALSLDLISGEDDIIHGDMAPFDFQTHQAIGDKQIDIADALIILRKAIGTL